MHTFTFDPVHVSSSHFLKTHFIIVLPSCHILNIANCTCCQLKSAVKYRLIIPWNWSKGQHVADEGEQLNVFRYWFVLIISKIICPEA
jgi:hypothetical protein